MSSGVCQAQTRIQEQRVLGSNQIVVHSELDTMCTQTRIGAQGCNQTWIQSQSVLGLNQQGIQIKASNCD
jgi:hypothetical protein